MNWFAKSSRYAAKLRFRMLRLATIKDIPTDRFNLFRAELRSEGWIQTYEYSGFDAWIDYGCVKLQKGRDRLKLEWDNWTEGSIEGPRPVLAAIGERMKLPVSSEWRWSDCDAHPQDAQQCVQEATRETRAP